MKDEPWQLTGWGIGIVGTNKGEFILMEPSFRIGSGAQYQPPSWLMSEAIARKLLADLSEKIAALSKPSSSSH